MAGFGFGFGSYARSRGMSAALRVNAGGELPPVVEPSADWNGTTSSGFDGSFGATPSDPVRVTAKPACRLLTPPHRAFADTHTVGVVAMANLNGSLMENLGLEKVIVHYEGATAEIHAPSFHTFADANGNAVTYHGWWVTLAHNGIDGLANVYFEAVPKDPSIQNRVIGPYTFLPRTTPHDLELEVAPSQPVISGQRYQSLVAAYDYARAQSAVNPRITVTEAGRYAAATGYFYIPAGTCTIEASVPITIGEVGPRSNAKATMRTRTDRMRFVGSNITLDFDVYATIYTEVPDTGGYQFDGVIITNSAGADDLHRGLIRSGANTLVRQGSWFTECQISNLGWSGSQANLVRGCTFDSCWADLFYISRTVIGNRIINHTSTQYRNYVEAMSVQYNGAGAAATLEMTGSNIANSRTLTAKVDGVSVGVITVTNTEADWIANSNYTVQNVVDWINSMADWSATLLDDSRAGVALQASGTVGPWGPVDVKNGPTSFYTFFDIHADFVQGANDNAIVMNNLASNCNFQGLYFADAVGTRDTFAINNALHNQEPVGDISQLGRAHSHVVIAHNSLATQDFKLRVDLSYNPDSYCLLANNSLPSCVWIGAPDGDLLIAGNHLDGGETVPANATNTTIGDTMIGKYVDAENGDFTPLGALVANPTAPVYRFDLNGQARAASAAKGAVAAPG